MATSVSVSAGPGFQGPLLFTIAAQPLSGRSTDEIERVIYEEIDRLRTDPPTSRELQRVQNQVEAGEVHRLSSNFGLAHQLAESAAVFGDWRQTFRASALLSAVTAADVQRVAAKYLVGSNRTVAVLVRPEATDRNETAAPAAGPGTP